MLHSSASSIIEEDWMYFKQDENDPWLLKYCRFQPPFFFIYKNEDLKRSGKPDIILIINENLKIHKTNDRIAFCGFVKLRQKFSTKKDHWCVVTREGYIIIGKLYHVHPDGTKKSIASHRKSTKRHFSVGMIEDLKDYNHDHNDNVLQNTLKNAKKNSSNFCVISTKEHDDMQRIHKWDINNIMIIHTGSQEVVVEERQSKEKLAQLRFANKEQAAAFTQSIRYCGEDLAKRRRKLTEIHPDVSGVGKPLFPLQIEDTQYGKYYLFISLNHSGINKWFRLLQSNIIEPSIKPLINRLEMNDSSLVNLEQVDEIYDYISRDLNIHNHKSNSNNNAMQRIINLPLEKRILILHQISITTFDHGVCYWILILENPKDPLLVLKLFLKHIDKQAVKKAKFIEEFVENDGLISLLSIHKKLKHKQNIYPLREHSEVRILLAKVFEMIASAPPFNETIQENEATEHQKYQAMKRKQETHTAHHSTKSLGDKDDLLSDEEEMRRLYADTESDSDSSEEKEKRKPELNDTLSMPPNIKTKQSTIRQQTGFRVIGNNNKQLPKSIQIRYKSGAEVIFESEQKEEVMEYLVTSIWGSHETEITQYDLLPCIGSVKCLFTLCLLKPEFASYITTILLDVSDLGRDNDNWWLPITKTMESALDLYKTATTLLSGTGNMFIVQDECRQYIFALLTFILTTIDSFEIKDRIIERKMLDSIEFNELLYEIQNNIHDQKIHSIIELYKESQKTDINDDAYAEMEITAEFLDYLRDKTIQNGFHEYFSSILQNLTAFPDDSEEAWNNVDKYIFHWRSKFDDDNDEHSITPQSNENDHEIDHFLSMEQVEKMEKSQALKDTIQHLEEERIELNSKYQSQLTKNNELQLLLNEKTNEFQDKLAELQHKLKEMQIQQKKHKSQEIDDSDNKQPKSQDVDDSDDKKQENIDLSLLTAKDKELVEKYKKQFKIKVPKAAIVHKLKFKEKKPHLIPYIFPEEALKSEDNKVKETMNDLPQLSPKETEMVEKYKKQVKMKVPKAAIVHKLKFKEKKAYLIPYIFPEEAAKHSALQQLAILSAEDAQIVEKYKKQFKMKVPKAAIVHKLKFKEKKAHLIPYIFPEEINKQKKVNKVKKKKNNLPHDVLQKPIRKPKVAMLAFHWNKIKENELKQTIWYDVYHSFGKHSAAENDIFEVSKVEQLFGKQIKQRKKNKKMNKKKNDNNVNNVHNEVIVLDKKTRNKVEIFLNRVRMSWNMNTSQICQYIAELNDDGLAQDHIEKLATVAPNEKEVKEFRKSVAGKNSNDILSKPALFWQELINVDLSIKDRLILWNFKLSFYGLMHEEEIKADLLNECIVKIRNDAHFKRVLSFALDIGNYVNGGKRQGQSYGFSIATLEKLDQFPRRRNADGSSVPTMLEYIYKLLQQKEADTLLWTNNLQILNKATTIDLNVININLKKFEKNINLLSKRLKSTNETQMSGKTFIEKMQPFYEQSCKQLATFKESVNLLNKELSALSQWFGVDDGENVQVLKQLNTFRKTFDSIGARLIKRQKEIERKARRQQKKNKVRKKKIPKRSPQIKIDNNSEEMVLDRRGTILRAMATSLSNEVSSGSLTGKLAAPLMNKSVSVNVNAGGLRNELMKLAASVKTIQE